MITLNLYRDNGTTPIATQTRETWPWSRAVYRFKDSGPRRRYEQHLPGDRERRVRDLHPLAVQPPGHGRLAEPAGLPDGGHQRRHAALHWRLDDVGKPRRRHLRQRQHRQPRRWRGHRSARRDRSATTRIATNGIDGYVTSTAPVTPGRGVHQLGLVQHHHRAGRRDHGLLRRPERRSACGTTAPCSWRTTAGSCSASAAATSRNPGMSFVRSLGTLQRRELAPGHHRLQRDQHHHAVHGRRAQVATLNITQPIIPGPGYLRAGYMDLVALLHDLRLELRRQAARPELLLGRPASTRPACTSRHSRRPR